MGFINKLKANLKDNDETIREVDYEEDFDDEEEEEFDEYEEEEFFDDDEEEEEVKEKKPFFPSLKLPKRREKKEESFHDSFLKDVKKKKEAVQKDYDKVPDFASEAVKGNVKNVLTFMNIPESYTIKKNVFMPEDIDDISFSQQAPIGYDSSEVDNFVYQTKASIEYYISLLKERNVDIAKLATAIDKFQVDMANKRFEEESAAGISISSGDPMLESQLAEAKLKIHQLEKTLKSTDAEVSREILQENLSLKKEMGVLKQEKNSMAQEIRKLKERLNISIEESYSEGLNDNVQENDLPEIDENSSLPDISFEELLSHGEGNELSREEQNVFKGLVGEEEVIDPFFKRS